MPSSPFERFAMDSSFASFATPVTRRGFLKGSAAAAFGAMWQRNLLAQTSANAKWANQIGLELYTVRDIMENDFEGVLAKVAALGYKEVEPANGYNNMSPDQFRKLLDGHGLSAPTTHY